MVETPDDMLHSVPAKTTALLLMIGPFVVLGCFVVPSGYDWWIIDSLSNENARINMIGIALVPLIADDLFNLLWRDVPWISSRVVPALCMAMIFVTLWALLSRIHEAKWFSRSCVFASGIVFSLYLLTLPDPALAWYTASEALPLQLGVAALLLTLAALAAEDNPRWAVVPAFVAGALTATVGIMATAVLTAAALIRSPEKRRLHLCVAGVAAIGTLLAILHHQQLVPLTESRLPLGNALRRAGGMAGYAWVTWLLNPEVLLGGLLLVPPLAGRLKESAIAAVPPRRGGALFILVFVAAIISGALEFQLLGDATTLRGMNAVYVFFLLSTAVLCVWGAARADFEILNTRARSAAAAILVAVLLAAPEARLPQALIAAARAPAWHAAQMSRFAVLTEERDNNQKRDIVVDPIAPVPFISHADLREEPQAWTNRYCASWFGARSIAVRKDDDVR